MPAEHLESAPSGGDLGDLVAGSGIRHVHVLAWRDLDDTEAGGSEVHAHEVVSRWADAGLAVTLRTSEALGLPGEVERSGYRVIRRGGRYTLFPRAVLAEMTGRHGPRDAVVEVWNGVPFLTPIWAAFPRMTILHHHHGALWPSVLPRIPAGLGSLLERRLAPPFYRTTPIVTLSESSRAELIRDLHLRPDTVHVVEPGIDAGYGPGGDRSPTPLVLSVGRLTTAKRVDVMIRAVEGVRRQVPGTRLEIIGDGPAEADLRSLVEGLDATEWVRLRGRVGQPDLLDAYRRAWVLASASVSEGWGMTLTEAAACGTPGVATRIPGHEDAVEDGVSGLLADDDRQLVDHLARVLSDDVGRSALEAGALTNAARYTWERTATEAFRVLASTVGR